MEKKNIDNRMAWIRNLKKLSSYTGETYAMEYEFVSECRIPGVLSYDGEKIICSLLSEKDKDGLYHYLMRVAYPTGGSDEFNRSQYHKNGYYFKDGIIGELLSIFSLYFQARFYLVSSFSGGLSSNSVKHKIDSPFLYKPTNQAVHPKIFTDGKRNFARGLSDFLELIKNLDESKHQGFILACYHYARALKEVGVDSEMVFIRLVSAIETLSSQMKLKQKDDIFFGKETESFIKAGILNEEQFLEIKNIFDVRKSRIRFIRFVEKYCKGAFHGGNWKARHVRLLRINLPRVLSAIYNARSKYLHLGEPMYLSQFMHGAGKWDTDPSLGMMIDNREFSASQKLPYTYWFENIVRCCLLNYLKEQKVAESNQPHEQS